MMKAYWTIDSTFIGEFKSFEEATKKLDEMPDEFEIEHGDRKLKIKKEDVTVTTT